MQIISNLKNYWKILKIFDIYILLIITKKIGYTNSYFVLISGTCNGILTFYISNFNKKYIPVDDCLDVFNLQALPGAM